MGGRGGHGGHDGYVVCAEALEKRYGEKRALDGFDLLVREGTVHGLLGPNGAGKTTAVRILATLLRLDGGHATVAGLDVATRPREVRSRIGLTGQYAALDEILTGRQNLEMFGRLFHLGGSGRGCGRPNSWSGSTWWPPPTRASRATAAVCGAVSTSPLR